MRDAPPVLPSTAKLSCGRVALDPSSRIAVLVLEPVRNGSMRAHKPFVQPSWLWLLGGLLVSLPLDATARECVACWTDRCPELAREHPRCAEKPGATPRKKTARASISVRNGCSKGMVLIPGAAYTVKRRGYPQRISVKSFCLDALDVTVASYSRCVKQGKCKVAHATVNWPDGEGNRSGGASQLCNTDRKDRQSHPVNCVTFTQAAGYCESLGKRLPTEDEYEWAARGARNSTYPWGRAEPGSRLCWNGDGNDVGRGKRRGTCPVGQFPSGNSRRGIKDLAGNVLNWTSSRYSGPLATYDCSGLSACRILRGSAWWADEPTQVSAASRGAVGAMNPLYRGAGVGFRCAATP